MIAWRKWHNDVNIQVCLFICASVCAHDFVRTYLQQIRKQNQNTKYQFDSRHKQLAKSEERQDVKHKQPNTKCMHTYIYLYASVNACVCTLMICSRLSWRAVEVKVMALTFSMVKAVWHLLFAILYFLLHHSRLPTRSHISSCAAQLTAIDHK